MTPTELLHSLSRVRWDIARRTFGSSHATLIGLMSQWWIDLGADHNVLDGAPSFGHANAGWCDLMLCEQQKPFGVVEVEGTRHMEKLHTIGQYFASSRHELAGIKLGILVSYAYHPRGRGNALAYPSSRDSLVMARAEQLSQAHPDCALVVVNVDKAVDRGRGPLRETVKYYWGSVSTVSATLFAEGQEKDTMVLLQDQSFRGSPEQ